MKRISLFLIYLFISQVTIAQISLNRNDFGNIGDTILLERDFTGLDSIVPGNSGANQNWDFSFLSKDSIPDTLLFLDPQGFSQSSMVPNANIVIKDGPQLQFLEATNSSVLVHDLTIDLDTFFNNIFLSLNPPIPQLSFPVDFNDSSSSTHTSNSITLAFQDTISIGGISSFVDSIRITPTIERNEKIDAWGNLLLLDSAEFEVLRQKTTLTISMELSVLIPNPLPFPPPFIWFQLPSGTVPEIMNTNYFFIAKGKNFPLLELVTDSVDNVLSARFQTDTTSNDTTLGGIEKISPDFAIYPNPVSNELIVNHDFNIDSHYRIIDALGRVKLEGTLNSNSKLIGLNELDEGIYILQIEAKNSFSRTFKIIKDR